MQPPPHQPEAERNASPGAARAKSDERPDVYLALLAHELRNQLAPIRYAIASLEKPDRTLAQQEHALSIMRRQSTQMSRLLEDLLDISRFARGELELRHTAAELSALLGTAVETARPLLDSKNQYFALELPEGSARVWADPTRLSQVFSNLLINAAKYTGPGGRIVLRASLEADFITVSVVDSGIGIKKEMIPQIFTLFAQDPAARAHSEGGLGIGLALAQGIVHLHGGTIEARSEGPDCGSEFLVRLPRVALQGEHAVVPEDGTVKHGVLKVLVVDDNEDIADTCAMLIELSGHQVRCAYNGTDALKVAQAFRPQVILTDIGLPDIDGYSLARQILATGWGRAAILVAVTGWSDSGSEDQSAAAGFQHHLTKPVDPELLASLLQSLTASIDRQFL